MDDNRCNKRKILLVTNGYPFGDSERSFLSTELRYLEKSFDVSILARISEPPRSQWEGVDADRVSCTGASSLKAFEVLAELRRRDVREELQRAFKDCRLHLFAKRASAILRYSARANSFQETLKKLCAEKEIDMIYTFWCTQITLAAVRIAKEKPRIKVTTRFHGYDLYDERTAELWQPFRRDIALGCEKLFFASDAGRLYFLKQWGNEFRDKALVSYLGCRDMSRVTCSSEQELTVVSCSNAIPLKRVDLIIDALSELPQEKRIIWHHFGDGSELEALKRQAKNRLKERDNIRWKFWGRVPNNQLDGFYRELGAQVFITTTSTEGGAPVSIQEAFSMGIPAIATKVGGIPEVVKDKVTGFLLPENPTAAQISSAIERFSLLTQCERETMSINARQMWQEKCNAKRNSAQFAQELENLLHDGREG